MLTKVTLKICQKLGERLRKIFENKSPRQLKLHGHTLIVVNAMLFTRLASFSKWQNPKT